MDLKSEDLLWESIQLPSYDSVSLVNTAAKCQKPRPLRWKLLKPSAIARLIGWVPISSVCFPAPHTLLPAKWSYEKLTEDHGNRRSAQVLNWAMRQSSTARRLLISLLSVNVLLSRPASLSWCRRVLPGLSATGALPFLLLLGESVVEFTVQQAGTYPVVTHSFGDADAGALGFFKATD
jgi:hypothetical protein